MTNPINEQMLQRAEKAYRRIAEREHQACSERDVVRAILEAALPAVAASGSPPSPSADIVAWWDVWGRAAGAIPKAAWDELDAAIRADERARAGRSPAEVPPTEDTKRLDWLESKLSYRGNIELWGHPGERAHIALGEAETAVGLRNLRAAIDNAMQEAAVWRSAQQ